MVETRLTPPSHKQLRQVVTERLRTAILEGQLKPGEWLRQERLAQQYGVSHMPVREALKDLAAEGLVEHVPYRGVRVVAFTPADVADLYAHRSLLEGMTARAAASSITPDEIAELRTLQTQMKQHLAPEHLTTYRALNHRFHQVIFTASRRAYLIRTLNQMWNALPTMLWSNFVDTETHSLPGRDRSDPAEHDAIIAALAQADPDAAEQAMRQHIEEAGQQLVALLHARHDHPS